VPAVGGAAVLLGLAVGGTALGLGGQGPLASSGGGGGWPSTWAASFGPLTPAWLLALLAAFGAGLADDLRRGGLAPRAKLLAQVLAGLPLLAAALAARPDAAGLAIGLGLVAGALVAINAVNTFDNSDGAAGTLGLLALAAPAPLAAAALLGFLPFNLDARRQRAGRAAPTCYLGDSGSHLVGMLIALTPPAWPALWLPLLDLGRLSVLRLTRGSRPWIGDRRHLAHRLEAAGLGRGALLGCLAGVALPSVALGAAGILRGEAVLVLGGLLATALLYLLALRWTRDPG
jgi:UDP-GlcNAc:undecaprenyl-phosphate GlcNAc-1-phosphate transferase